MSLPEVSEHSTGQRSGARSGWRLAAGLVLLSVIPLAAVVVLRLVELDGGLELRPADPRVSGPARAEGATGIH